MEIGVDVPNILVYTAYANSRATKFLEENEINIVCVPTGVKNAHPEVQKYVIGANDEPNGHGTIFVDWEKLTKLLEGHEEKFATKKLLAFLRLSNIYVGDAIANMLMCEAVMRDLGMSMEKFSKIYIDNPSRMFKI